jgi:hypothetical protein
MVAVNIATVAYIRCIRRLVHPTVSHREYHLIILVIAHNVSNLILTLLYTINKFIYYTFKNSISSEKICASLERFFNQSIFLLLSN